MSIAAALSKIKKATVYDQLKIAYRKEKDYRVQINVINTLKNAPYETSKFFFRTALNNPNVHVAKAAGSYFIEKGIPKDAGWYWTLARDTLKEPLSVVLYIAGNKHLSPFFKDAKAGLNAELKFKFDQAIDPYLKADYIRALAEYPFNYRIIRQFGLSSGYVQVRTTSIEALSGILKDPAFYYNFGTRAKEAKRELVEIMAQAIISKDVGLIAIASEAIREPKLNFKLWFSDISFMKNALNKLAIRN